MLYSPNKVEETTTIMFQHGHVLSGAIGFQTCMCVCLAYLLEIVWSCQYLQDMEREKKKKSVHHPVLTLA